MIRNHCYQSIIDTIGHTPLVKLNRVASDIPGEVFAKLEFLNPMGSSKDRIARYMIEKAEKEGKIKKGDLIIENSSGNTAMGLALIAIQKGYRLKVIVRDRISREKLDQLKALGVEIHMVDSSLPPESPYSYNNITPLMARETPNCYFPDQHNNRDNNEAHYLGTGPEIWEQMQGKIDYFVAGIGTGGTIGGTARFLKEKDPAIEVIAIDPAGSVFYGHFNKQKNIASAPYLLEGLGDEFMIHCADFSVIDEMFQVSDKEAFQAARELALREGILAGGSSGAALWGVRQLAKKLNRPARIVTVFPDGASRYLSTIYNDDWLKDKGMI
jgi:cystathionine beta-synthase